MTDDDQPQKPLIMVDPHWFEGVPFPGVFSQKTLESLKHTQVYDDDIYVAAYPKSGISCDCFNRCYFLVLVTLSSHFL